MSAPVACKTANETEPLSPLGGARILVLLRPFHRQSNRDVGRTILFEKRSELDQAIVGVQQLESKLRRSSTYSSTFFRQPIIEPLPARKELMLRANPGPPWHKSLWSAGCDGGGVRLSHLR